MSKYKCIVFNDFFFLLVIFNIQKDTWKEKETNSRIILIKRGTNLQTHRDLLQPTCNKITQDSYYIFIWVLSDSFFSLTALISDLILSVY